MPDAHTNLTNGEAAICYLMARDACNVSKDENIPGKYVKLAAACAHYCVAAFAKKNFITLIEPDDS